MAGKKVTHYLPYGDALEYIRRHKPAKSRADYVKWHAKNKPDFLPRYPNRVYAEWESWSVFLGTTNSFEKTRAVRIGQKITYRPFWEAVRYAQQKAKEHNLKTMREWEQWYDSGMCARDVPKRPHHAYTEFAGKGWSVWLGLKPQQKQIAAKQKVAVIALCQTRGYPANCITVLINQNGVSDMVDKWDRELYGKPYRVYNWEQELVAQVDRIMKSLTFDKGNSLYLVPNMNALLFELDSILEYTIPPNKLPRVWPV